MSTQNTSIAIEMDDINDDGYGVLHRAGCRDLSDGMPVPVAEGETWDEAADDATGWEYVAEGSTYKRARCLR